MSTRIQLRRDTAANWTTNNPTLALGEMGIETDTRKFKFGDGNTSWTSLAYASSESGDTIEAGENISITESSGTKTIDVKDVSKTITSGVLEGTHFDGFLYYTNATTTRDKLSITERVDKIYGYSVYSLADIEAGSTIHVKIPLFYAVTAQCGLVVFTDDELNVLLDRCYVDTDLGGLPSGDGKASANSWKVGFEPRIYIDEDFTVPEGATKMYVGVRPYGRWETVTINKEVERVEDFKSLTDDYMNATTTNTFSTSGETTTVSSVSLTESLAGLNNDVSSVVDSLRDDNVLVPASVSEGYMDLGTKGTNTSIEFKQNANYMYKTYNVTAGQMVRIKTKWISPLARLPIYVFADNNGVVKSSKIYQPIAANTCQLDVTDEVMKVPDDATKLYVGTNKILNFEPEASLGASSTSIEELTPMNTWDSWYQITNSKPVKQATAELYRTLIYNVSAFAGQTIRIKTYWYSGMLELPLITTTNELDDTGTVNCSLYYKQFAKKIADVADVDIEFTVPKSAKALYVAVRPEDIEHPEVECKVSTIASPKMLSVKNINSSVQALASNTNEPKYDINLLFIGNSLTQDAVSYVPWILNRLAPEVNYNIWMWYNGGYTLERQLEKWNSNGKAEMVSNWKKGDSKWTTYSNSITIQQTLAKGPFDVISLQEYFNYKTKYDSEDLQVYNDCLDFIRNNLSSPFYLAELLHQPHQTYNHPDFGPMDVNERFNFLVDSTKIMWNNLPMQSIIPGGFAMYHAKDTILHSLGTTGDTYFDTTHAQEGIGCQMLGWITAEWILRHIGYPGGVLNDPTPITSSIQSSLNIPGANGSVVTGSTAQYRVAQELAANAFKECDAIFGTQKAKTGDLDNDAGFLKQEEVINITDEKIFSGTTGENITATASGCPYVMADYMQFNGKVLTSIKFLVKAAGTFTFGIYPNATDIAATVGQYSSYVKLFKITTTSDDIDSRIEYVLDGSDNRVTILDSSYLTDEGIAIPDTGIVGLGDATETPVWGVNARNSDTSGYWRNSSENVFYATKSGTQFTNVSKTGNAGFTIKAKLPSTHKEILPVITKKSHMKEVLAHVAMSENPLTPAGNTNAPYIYRESSTLQNRWITEFGFKATAVGKQCTVVLGEISGSATEIVLGNYDIAFVITADTTDFTNYKLDGSDPRVEMNPNVLTNGRLYVDDRHTLGFSTQNTTNDGWYCITNNNDQYKQDIVHPRETFYGTKNWSERPAKNYSTFNGCLAFNIKTEYEIMDSQSTNINPLKGKKISFLGDSISTFNSYMPAGYSPYYPCADVQDVEQTWWMQIVRKGDMVLGQNCGWAGSTVTGACTGSSAAAGCSDQRIADLALNGIPDIVVCFIGVNDIRTNVAKGNFTFDSQLPANSGTISTFSEAYALMVSKIMNAYRHTRVFCCSILENRNIPSGSSIDPYVYPFTNDTGFTIPQLNNCIKDICLCLGAEFVDLHACGINFWNMEEYAQDALAPSKACHPNANGCKLMADKIYGTIAQAYNCGNY